MDITQSNLNGVQVIEVKGRLTADCAENYKQTLMDIVAKNNRLVIDLAQLEYIDSTGLGAMVYVLQQTLDNGGELKLAHLQGKSRIVFDITKAYKIFDIFDTVDEAAAAIKNK